MEKSKTKYQRPVIVLITWNWFYSTDADYGQEYSKAEVGKDGVEKIEALSADALPGVYRVTMAPDSEGVIRELTIYNPCEVITERRPIA